MKRDFKLNKTNQQTSNGLFNKCNNKKSTFRTTKYQKKQNTIKYILKNKLKISIIIKACNKRIKNQKNQNQLNSSKKHTQKKHN